MSVMEAARTGFALSGRRLLGSRPLVVLGLGLVLTGTSAAIEISASPLGAVDRTLAATFRLLIPLVAFALATDAAGREHLREAAWPAARFGLGRGAVVLGMVAATVVGTAIAGALLAVLAAIAAHTAQAPPLAGDAVTSGVVGALAGAAYAGWFSLGGTLFKRGRGRVAPLLADLLLGGSTGVLGVVLPRGHTTNLIGGAPPLGLSQPASAGLLVAAALLLGLAAALRTRD
ncbi:hypothetical protein [Chondromyces crocatus]|uniref:Uncharacterized protein n=1 Tax=Chondromyces crocatus TaxID=52 RepID=A0A0K1EM59_CHOCO|nr:hypothetical protein [Chondromyces crocatus]AKT41901.1 uncharacterized protein CMC5_061230 [Chondromyces crocatus]